MKKLTRRTNLGVISGLVLLTACSVLVSAKPRKKPTITTLTRIGDSRQITGELKEYESLKYRVKLNAAGRLIIDHVKTATRFEVKIYDSRDELVGSWSREDHEPGRQLPIGIYVLVFSATGDLRGHGEFMCRISLRSLTDTNLDNW